MVSAPKPHLPHVAEYIQSCATYQPGKPIEELERELGIHDIVKMASNENPLGPSPKALAAIQRACADLHLYPDATHYRLREAIAARNGVDIEEVFIGNGSEEIFSLLIRTFCKPGDTTVSCGAAFLAYRVCSQVHGVTYKEPQLNKDPHVELDEILKMIDEKTRIVFLPNPNNPTGTYLPRALMKKVLDELKSRNIVVLLDYAYKEYARATDLPDPMEFYREYPNLIVTRTFSKIYGLGGLRVGYAFAHPDLLLSMRKVKMPFNVSSLGMAGALAALEDDTHVKRSIEVNLEGLDFLHKELSAMNLDIWPTQGNFYLVKMPKDAKRIYEEMLKVGVILRPVAGYGLKEHLRITVGTKSQNLRLIQSLKKVLGAL